MADEVETVTVLGAVETREQAEAQAKMFGKMAVRIIEVRTGSLLGEAGSGKTLGFFAWPKVTTCPCCHRDGPLPSSSAEAEPEGAPV